MEKIVSTINTARMERARQLALGGILLLIETERDDLTVTERVAAINEVMGEDGEDWPKGSEPIRIATGAVYH